MREIDIQNQIRLAVDPYMVVFRANVGRIRLDNGRWFDTGLPRGFSDLFGVRRSDGRAVFIEVKNEKGKTSKYQDNFLKQMKKTNAIVGVARSAEEAIQIVTQGYCKECKKNKNANDMFNEKKCVECYVKYGE